MQFDFNDSYRFKVPILQQLLVTLDLYKITVGVVLNLDGYSGYIYKLSTCRRKTTIIASRGHP